MFKSIFIEPIKILFGKLGVGLLMTGMIALVFAIALLSPDQSYDDFKRKLNK